MSSLMNKAGIHMAASQSRSGTLPTPETSPTCMLPTDKLIILTSPFKSYRLVRLLLNVTLMDSHCKRFLGS